MKAIVWLLLALFSTLVPEILAQGVPSPPLPDNVQPAAGLSGAIEGRVAFQGRVIPGATVVDNATDPQFSGTRHSLEDNLISQNTRGIGNLILSVVMDRPPAAHPPGETLVLNNRDCRFQPHVAVLTAGSAIEAVNSDSIFHTTHLYYGPLSRNLALGVGERARQPVNRPGFVIVKCDIHGWMKAFVRVDAHPFHAVSDAEGRFRIEGIPAGSYMLEVWHEYFGQQDLAVTVAAGKTARVAVEYGSDERRDGK
ncbi:MAG: carboxypeptidase regulatory-like domain-containing protein [Acidobacteria bacterium]|nr:carboxypeptidase regulatory-like domain-containing protein [Acidobacteriota bacterium]